GADLFVSYRAATPDAPFDDDQWRLDAKGGPWSEAPDEEALGRQVRHFDPDAVLVISWGVGAYRRLSRSLRGRTLRLLCMDNAWLGTAKQWGGRALSPVLIRPTYDAAFLCGDRQADFARRLGFPDDRILWGLYTCDHPTFAAVAAARPPDPPHAFLFAGRLVPEKGVDVLADAYARYRVASADPWPLVVCGTGPLDVVLDRVAGVERLGFVQPHDLPDVYARTGCLVLPSRFEPWGVAIHEATSAGLAVVCSSACGASSRLVLDGFNGAVIPPGDAVALADALARIAASTTDRAALSRHSSVLAAQFTPQRWAGYLMERVMWIRRRLGLDGG
ncbi:MAG: glycosyltransferase family 4 protein, partial [Acidimicrobiales bacterium]